MPRAVANVTVRRPITPSVRLSTDGHKRLRRLLSLQELPDGFLPRLEDAINICRQHARRRPATPNQGVLALEQIAEYAQALCLLLGQPGDAVAGPLARLCRWLPGGLDRLRNAQGALEEMALAAKWARQALVRNDLAMSPYSAKVSMAARIAELLDDYGIQAVTTTEPKLSIYLGVVKFALGYVGGGDMRAIPAEGLHLWRQHVQRAMAGPWNEEHFCT